jgi:hypothetical protein
MFAAQLDMTRDVGGAIGVRHEKGIERRRARYGQGSEFKPEL